MKKENLFDMLEHAEEGSMNELTEKCPDIGDEQFERMLARSERKYKMMKKDIDRTEKDNIFMSENTVSGVKRVKRPVWLNPLAVAASFVLIAGTVVGSIAFMSKNNRTVKSGGTTPAATATTTDKVGSETTVNSTNTSTVKTTETKAVTTVSTSAQENIAQTNVQVVGVQETIAATESNTNNANNTSNTSSQEEAFVGRLNQSYQEKYKNEIQKFVDEAISSGENLQLNYVLKDLTGDGTPELIIKRGQYEVDSFVTVYNSDMKVIGDMFRGSYTGFYENSSGAFAFVTAHMGYFCVSYPVYDAASDQLTIGTQNEKDYGAYGSYEDIEVLLKEEGLTSMNDVSIFVDRGSVTSYYGSQTFDYPYYGIIV